MTDDTAECSAGLLGEVLGRGLLVLGLVEPDLDQLMIGEGRVDGTQNGFRRPAAADLDHGFQRMGLAAQEAALEALEFGGFRHGGTEPRQALLSVPVRTWVSWMGVALLGASVGCASDVRLAAVTPPVPAPPPARAAAPPALDDAVQPVPAPAPEPVTEVEPEAQVVARQVLEARAPKLSPAEREEVARLLAEAEAVHELPVLTVLGVIQQESRFEPRARGPRGSLGLMQIRPFVAADVAKRHGFEWAGYQTLYEPVANVRIGLTYLAEQHARFGEVNLALAAYNVGPTRLRQLLARGKGRNGPYVRRVTRKVEALTSEFAPADTATAGGS